MEYSRPSRRCRCIFLFCLLALLARPVPGRTEISDDFELRVQQGIRFAEQKQYEAALASFRAAYQLNPEPRILVRIGRTLALLGLHGPALDAYDLFLKIGHPDSELEQKVLRYRTESQDALEIARKYSKPRERRQHHHRLRYGP